MLESGSGPGGEYTGWVHLPQHHDPSELKHIKTAAEQIRNQSDALVVVGIGGSYLGTRAVLEFLLSPNYNLLQKDSPQIFFAGNTLSSDAWNDLRLLLENKDVSVNVISKSGSTIETSSAFLLLRNFLAKKYSPEELRKQGYETFPIPPNIGGRYSVLTAVGLLPLAACGIDIDAVLDGAKNMRETLSVPGEQNPAFQYAAARHALFKQGKQIELLASHDPYLRCFGEWWKQLFGESEGKNNTGLFPATAEFSADLHSLGQYIQAGQRILLETVIYFDRPLTNCPLPNTSDPNDSLAFLQGQDLQFVSLQAFRGTLLAHVDGGVPNLLIRLSERSAENVGRLIYFFEYACGLSAYLLGVNPFDQPGVEAYKHNMLALLGRPGLEKERNALERRFC
jgi:glucose-6-phosphate isomerase